jgi:hypothetical protein
MGGEHACYGFRTKRLSNYRACSIRVLGGNATWHPHDPETLRLEPPVALDVGLDSADMLMNLTIDFDDQPALQAGENDDERANRVLTAKPQPPLLATSQNFPQRLLGRGGS